jgi:DNA-directed RNA polymerase subunit E'/Rpb7
MDNNSFIPSLLTEKVKLSPKYMNKSFSQKLLNHLIEKNEGKCSKHGYIKRNSISITKISTGIVEAHTLHGFLNYMVQFKALVCNPTNGSVIKCKVVSSNNFGVLCSSGITDENNEYKAIMDIIVPKNSLNIRSDANIDFDKIVPNQILDVEIVGKKFEINDEKISAVGKIVKLDEDARFVDVEINEDDDVQPEIEDIYEDETIEDTGIVNSPKNKDYSLKQKNMNEELEEEDREEEDEDDEQEDNADVEDDEPNNGDNEDEDEEEEENDNINEDDDLEDNEDDEKDEDEDDVDLDDM